MSSHGTGSGSMPGSLGPVVGSLATDSDSESHAIESPAASSVPMGKSVSLSGETSASQSASRRSSRIPQPPVPVRRASENALFPKTSSAATSQHAHSTGTQSHDSDAGAAMLPHPDLPNRTSSRYNASPSLGTGAFASPIPGQFHPKSPRERTQSSGSGRRNSGVANIVAAPSTSDVQAHSADAGPSRPASIPTNVHGSHIQSTSVSQTSLQSPVRDGRSSRSRDQPCDACGKPMSGQFVRALGVVFHLDCFRCRDCNKVVAAKFFPATDDMNTSTSPAGSSGSHDGNGNKVSPTSGSSGKLFPLCETDYFRRLDLICANCGGALRGSYITALGKKFHVEHFTCSICPTVFGPQDSYYEHDGKVFCHFHYSTRFAIRCTGCRTAILKQFVEINRNNQDEHWHPECYMIHKFWNIKLSPAAATPRSETAQEPLTATDAPELEQVSSGTAPTAKGSASQEPSPEALETEANETPTSLKAKQKRTEEEVYRIWTVLSAFEESSAACISDMLRHVSAGRYLGGVQMAERFIRHVEVLFAAIDHLEHLFRQEQARGISHVREARMLCKKIVNFFSLLSHTQEAGAQRLGITQELLSLVTGLAHYLKILIRIALTGALRLEREFDNHEALTVFLDNLAFLAQEEGSPRAKAAAGNAVATGNNGANEKAVSHPEPRGYQSLPRSMISGGPGSGEAVTDLCVRCGQTVEEECVRIGVNLRWHTACLKCNSCHRIAQRSESASKSKTAEPADPDAPPPVPSGQFWLDVTRQPKMGEGGAPSGTTTTYRYFCADCKLATTRLNFTRVMRLEQYAYLLRVALIRLYALLRRRGVVPHTPPQIEDAAASPDSVNDNINVEDADAAMRIGDMRRMKTQNIEKRLSTKAKVPHISTVLGGGPSGKVSNVQKPPRSPSPATATGDTTGTAVRRSTSPLRKAPPYTGSQEQLGTRQVSARDGSGESVVFQQWSGVPLSTSSTALQGTHHGPIVPIRPAFARHNTDVQIQDQGPVRQPSGDETGHVLADSEEGLTLADIPRMLQAEQQARNPTPRMPMGRPLSELSQVELFVVKHMAVLTLQQTPLRDVVPFDELVEYIEIRKNTFWGKLFKANKDKKKVEKKGVFGVALEILVERSGADSTLGYRGAVLRVPSFIDDIISAMKQMDVTIEGIFRKNGNIRRLKELAEGLDRDANSVNLSDDNPVQLAALLKKWLRELPDPLMTFRLHKLWVVAQSIEPEPERLRCLHLISILLPKAHRDTMEVLFVFLRWVASFSHVDEETGSKMDLQNLSVVLAPNILYSKGSDPLKDELFLANRVLQTILEHQEEFWCVPPELEPGLKDRELLNPPADMTSRDLLRKCEKHIPRRSGSGARSGTMLGPPNGNGPPSGASQGGSGSSASNGRTGTSYNSGSMLGTSPSNNGFGFGGNRSHLTQEPQYDGSMSPSRSQGFNWPRSPSDMDRHAQTQQHTAT